MMLMQAVFGAVLKNSEMDDNKPIQALHSWEFDTDLWYNTPVINRDLLVGRSGWLFMCGLHPLSQ